jgi:hypothetical protein
MYVCIEPILQALSFVPKWFVRVETRVARFVLVKKYQNGKNVPTKRPQTIPNGYKLHEMNEKYSQWS